MSVELPPASGPVVFAYDGSELARLAIDEAGRLLDGERDALVVTVWQPYNVGFVPPAGDKLDAQQAGEVKAAAQRTASEGVSLAQAAGFRARALAVEGAPSWKGVVSVAEEHDSTLIVLGSHGRTSLADVVLGSVAGAVASHSRRSVLIVHRRS